MGGNQDVPWWPGGGSSEGLVWAKTSIYVFYCLFRTEIDCAGGVFRGRSLLRKTLVVVVVVAVVSVVVVVVVC